jgi:hypothetical protein
VNDDIDAIEALDGRLGSPNGMMEGMAGREDMTSSLIAER